LLIDFCYVKIYEKTGGNVLQRSCDGVAKIFRSPRPLWAAFEANEFTVQKVPHKGAGLRFLFIQQNDILLASKRDVFGKLVAKVLRLSCDSMAAMNLLDLSQQFL